MQRKAARRWLNFCLTISIEFRMVKFHLSNKMFSASLYLSLLMVAGTKGRSRPSPTNDFRGWTKCRAPLLSVPNTIPNKLIEFWPSTLS